MEDTSGKVLVNLVNSFSDQQLFFIGWLALVAFFVISMYNIRRQRDRRNFRDTPYKMKNMTPPSKAVVVKDEEKAPDSKVVPK